MNLSTRPVAPETLEYRPDLPAWTEYGLRLLAGIAAVLLGWSLWVQNGPEYRLAAQVVAADNGSLQLRIDDSWPDGTLVEAQFLWTEDRRLGVKLGDASTRTEATDRFAIATNDTPPEAGERGILLLRGEPRSLFTQIVQWFGTH